MQEIIWIVFTHTGRQTILSNSKSDISLHSIESNYRRVGGYVYREAKTSRLWVFHWPRQGKDGLVDSSYYPAKAREIAGEIRSLTSESANKR